MRKRKKTATLTVSINGTGRRNFLFKKSYCSLVTSIEPMSMDDYSRKVVEPVSHELEKDITFPV